MAEDAIIVNIISNIDEITMRLDMVSTMGRQVTGGEDLSRTLPSINRELRLILGQISPAMRVAMSDYFRLLRIQRSVLIARKELKEAGEEITLRGMLLQPQMILTMIATLILIVKWLTERQKNIEREQQEYEAYIRRERNLTHDEYIELTKTWQSYTRSLPG